MVFVTMKIITKFLYKKVIKKISNEQLNSREATLLIQFSLAIVTRRHVTSNTNNNNHVFKAHRHVYGAVVPADLGEVGQRPDMIQVAAQHKLPQPASNRENLTGNCQHIKRKKRKG